MNGLDFPDKEHQIYPYLLRDVKIDRSDIAWIADLTYIRLKHGFVYLVAIMDLYSRYIISWRVSNTLETDFCCEALKNISQSGGVKKVSENLFKNITKRGCINP